MGRVEDGNGVEHGVDQEVHDDIDRQRGQIGCAGMVGGASGFRSSKVSPSVAFSLWEGNRRCRPASPHRDPKPRCAWVCAPSASTRLPRLDLGLGFRARKNPLSYWNSGSNLGCGRAIPPGPAESGDFRVIDVQRRLMTSRRCLAPSGHLSAPPNLGPRSLASLGFGTAATGG